jgi:hypothetical protein
MVRVGENIEDSVNVIFEEPFVYNIWTRKNYVRLKRTCVRQSKYSRHGDRGIQLVY